MKIKNLFIIIPILLITFSCDMFTEEVITNTYSVVYVANGADSGEVPVDSESYFSGDTAVVKDNGGALDRSNFSFVSWNTSEDGSGDTYTSGSDLIVTENVVLYATWAIESPELVVVPGIESISVTIPDEIISSSPDLYWSLEESGTYYMCIEGLERGTTELPYLNPGDNYFFKLKVGDVESSIASTTPLKRDKPEGIVDSYYNQFVGTWRGKSSTTKEHSFQAGSLLKFTENYTILMQTGTDSNGEYSFYWKDNVAKADATSIYRWGYSLNGDELTITINYENTGTFATAVFERVDLELYGLYVGFEEVFVQPLGWHDGFYFQEGEDRTSLTPFYNFVPGTIITPLLIRGNYTSQVDVSIIAPSGEKLWNIVPRTIPSSNNMIFNGNFDAGQLGWNNWFGENEIIDGSIDFSNGELYINTISASPLHKDGWEMPWTLNASVNNSENMIILEANKTYRISFDGKSDSSRRVAVIVRERARDLDGDSNRYSSYKYEEVTLTPSYASYQYEFTMPNITDNYPVIELGAGHEVGDLYIDNVSLVEVP